MNLKHLFKLIFMLLIGGVSWFFFWLFKHSETPVFYVLAFGFSALLYFICVVLLGLLAAMFEAKDWKL